MLSGIDISDDLLELSQRHVLLPCMAVGKGIQRHGGSACHLDRAEVLIILVAPDAQNIARVEMGFSFITDRDGFTPGQNVALKAFKKSDVVRLHVIIP